MPRACEEEPLEQRPRGMFRRTGKEQTQRDGTLHNLVTNGGHGKGQRLLTTRIESSGETVIQPTSTTGNYHNRNPFLLDHAMPCIHQAPYSHLFPRHVAGPVFSAQSIRAASSSRLAVTGQSVSHAQQGLHVVLTQRPSIRENKNCGSGFQTMIHFSCVPCAVCSVWCLRRR
jgi:hypothetical protein